MKTVYKCCVLLIITLYSCDPGFNATITNNSERNAIVQMQLNKSDFEAHVNSQIPLFKINGNPDVKLIEFDTANLMVKIEIHSGKRFEIESGLGSEPTFNLFEKLNIIASDTTVLKDKKEIRNAFEKKSGGFSSEYELQIK